MGEITPPRADDGDGDRQRIPLFTTPATDVKVHDLTHPLDIVGVGAHVDRITGEFEKDLPELRFYLMTENGDRSGKALKVARQATEVKVQERRTVYDEGLVAAQRIALAIGGLRGYPGYDGCAAADPWDAPNIEHAIAHRAVFAPDPIDDLEESTAFWNCAHLAVTSGMPLSQFLRDQGWEDWRIDQVKAAQADQASQDIAVIRARQAAAFAEPPTEGEGPGPDNPPETGQ
jgi:hypothetical protein